MKITNRVILSTAIILLVNIISVPIATIIGVKIIQHNIDSKEIINIIKIIYPIVAVILILNIMVIVVVFSNLIKKMRNLTKATKERLDFISQGNYNFRMDYTGYEEFDSTNKYINKLVDEVENKIADLQQSTFATIDLLTATLEAKDPYTKGHSVRVAEYSFRICKEMVLDDRYTEKLVHSALLHDIGKIGVHEDILNKPSRLSNDEYDKVKQHPVIAAQILSEYDAFKDLNEIVIAHHERYDGEGYPNGLKEKEIPLGARILAVADTFDAVTSDRVYRKGMSLEEAKKILIEEKGNQFDPYIVDAFLRIVDDIKLDN
ncbi:HD-GYP domain-containing protein [Clostridium grantii]|uniref:HDIG domain-containing protein n=1 Tax=Clostridium grantii DSM 8605 TaxID=1121316 RepID=A0A1M5V7M2_9CLOT|nr:HD-GYP domain-containing protein [Clostridium grantii]SHH71210.1 HDIG domain-containing protein [Clostridium grantii DSM 8605]